MSFNRVSYYINNEGSALAVSMGYYELHFTVVVITIVKVRNEALWFSDFGYWDRAVYYHSTYLSFSKWHFHLNSSYTVAYNNYRTNGLNLNTPSEQTVLLKHS